jgi:hypothetical protein
MAFQTYPLVTVSLYNPDMHAEVYLNRCIFQYGISGGTTDFEIQASGKICIDRAGLNRMADI